MDYGSPTKGPRLNITMDAVKVKKKKHFSQKEQDKYTMDPG